MSSSNLLRNIQYIDFTWANREMILSLLPHNSVVKFTLFCANQVDHLIDPPQKDIATKAIELTKSFLTDRTMSHWRCIESSQETMLEVFKLLKLSIDYDMVNQPAAALSTISYAVNSTTSSYRAPKSAVYCSADAVHALEDEDDEDAIFEQMDYLEDLVLELLEQSEREAWLKGVKL